MRTAAALLAGLALLAAGCAGGDEEPPPAGWAGLPRPLPADGSLPVEQFDDYAESVDEPWEREPRELARVYTRADELDGALRVTELRTDRDATVAVEVDRLADDSIRTLRFDLELERRDDGTWRLASARWRQRCQRGRGHQDLSPELCL